jgi:hypothetical protein
MAEIAASGIQTGMLTNRLMTRGFTSQGAGELVGGKPLTPANDLRRAAAALSRPNDHMELYLIALLQQIQGHNAPTTVLANLMKAGDDTAKSNINNIR